MKLLGNGTLSGAIQLKQNASTNPAFSQALELGNNYRVFIPYGVIPAVDEEMGKQSSIEGSRPDIIAASVYERQLDNDVFKRSVVQINEIEESESGRIIDLTPLQQYARFARVFFDAQYMLELENIKEEAKKAADKLGKPINESDLAVKLQKLKEEYYGDKEHTPVVYAAKSPVIGGGRIVTITEAVVVPLDEKGRPIVEKIRSTSLELNNKKMTAIKTLVNNAAYASVHTGYIEIGYSYMGKDKREAGTNATFQGISSDLSIKATAQDLWGEVAAKLEYLTSIRPETIASRNFGVSATQSVSEVISIFKKYVASKEVLLAYIDMEAEETKRTAADLVASGLIDGAPAIKAQLEAIAVENGEVTADEAADAAGDTHMSYQAAKQILESTNLSEASAAMEASGGDNNASDVEAL